MTILYKPVLIESAEQAEALPPGTLAYDPEAAGLVGVRMPASDYFGWCCSFDHDPTARSSDIVGWLALVSIEAEEEFVREIIPTTRAANPGTVQLWREQGLAIQSRLVTPWEEA